MQTINEATNGSLRLSPLKKFKNIHEAMECYTKTNPITAVYAFYANGNIYVGSTKNFKARITKHLSEYRVHYGSHPGLHKLFDSVGIDNVQVFIYEEEEMGSYLEELIDETKLVNRARLLEAQYMQQFMEYEMKVLSSDTYFKINREDVNKKISDIKRGVPIHSLRKPVKQYSLDGDFIKEYESLSSAGVATGTDISSIIRCTQNKAKTAGGYIWKR